MLYFNIMSFFLRVAAAAATDCVLPPDLTGVSKEQQEKTVISVSTF